jgi:hypothetical protein
MVEAPGHFFLHNDISVTVSTASNLRTVFYRFCCGEPSVATTKFSLDQLFRKKLQIFFKNGGGAGIFFSLKLKISLVLFELNQM